MNPFAFALLNHSDPERLLRLVNTLGTVYDHPPIKCHHDFTCCPLDAGVFPPCLSFVTPHRQTAWGSFSLIEASLAALQECLSTGARWIVLISGADYPVRAAADVLADLDASGADFHADYEVIDPASLTHPWQEVCSRRYFPHGSFPAGRKCFAGSQWMTLSPTAVRALLASYRNDAELTRHYAGVSVPDESYFHTVLANSSALRGRGTNRRYVVWGDAGPKTLTSADLPAIMASGAHFARKFSSGDTAVRDAIDKMLNIPCKTLSPFSGEEVIEPALDTGKAPEDGAAEETPPGQRQARAKILVGVCSAVPYADRRSAVRETWMSRPVEDVECLFFTGCGNLNGEEGVLQLDVDDSYDFLPAKMKRFFQAALEHSDFDWLFKCDDDTYVALDRLHGLIDERYELTGNEFVHQRGSPSGGAGYLLSRRLVALLAADGALPETGAEDIIIGEAAVRLGAAVTGTPKLFWNNSRHPSAANDLVTSHWCDPRRLRDIDAAWQGNPNGLERTQEITPEVSGVPAGGVKARHRFWTDHLIFDDDGTFRRASTSCRGRYRKRENGQVELRWFSWEPELLIPGDDMHRVVDLRDEAAAAAFPES